MPRIVINVGGQIFETTEETLKGADYFRVWLERWKDKGEKEEVLFIDRSSHIFKHVLSLLRDFTYQYPEKYDAELTFYGIDFTRGKTEDKNENKWKKLFQNMEDIKKNIRTIKSSNEDISYNTQRSI